MKIAIAGYGVEGKSSYAYWNTPEHDVTIADERAVLDDAPEGAKTILGEGAFDKLQDFDLVIRSAGVAPRKITTNGKIWSATNEFFAQCAEKNVPIIGVTGTKGKGTTCSLIASILRAAGETVHLVGNIGTPALDILPEIRENDIVVCELSSFQLWDLERSPQIAVVLMIEPDHLDVHADFEEYLEAKANIRRYQKSSDVCIYHPTNIFSEKVAATPLRYETIEGRKGQDSLLDNAHKYAVSDDDEVYVEEGFFCIQGRQICSIDNLQIAGVHNVENACAAISAVTELPGWPKIITREHVAEGLRNFHGLPHRLKFVRDIRGVRYYDDSIATTPGSAIAALRAFDQPKLIILGGSDKGADYSEIITVAKQTNSRVLAIGQTGAKIHQLCLERGVSVEREEGLMPDVVNHAAAMAHPGDIVILSPASASFDQYKSYADRGEQFVAAVNLR